MLVVALAIDDSARRGRRLGGAVHQMYAVHGTRGQAQLAAGAVGRHHGMQHPRRADDGVHGARGQTACATDADLCIDPGDHIAPGRAAVFGQGHRFASEQRREPGNGDVTTGRAAVDLGIAGGHRTGVGQAAVESAARALGLWQQRVDGRHALRVWALIRWHNAYSVVES